MHIHVVCGVATHGQNRARIQYVAVSLTKLLCSAVTFITARRAEAT